MLHGVRCVTHDVTTSKKGDWCKMLHHQNGVIQSKKSPGIRVWSDRRRGGTSVDSPYFVGAVAEYFLVVVCEGKIEDNHEQRRE